MRHPLTACELLIENTGAHLHSQTQLHGTAQGKLNKIITFVQLYLQAKLIHYTVFTANWCHKFWISHTIVVLQYYFIIVVSTKNTSFSEV